MLKKLLVTCITLIAGANTIFAANSLSDTSWNLVSYNWQEASGTLSFSTDKMYSKFCNNVSQWYTYDNNTITSDGMAISTMMYCEGLPMTLENNFDISTGWTSTMLSWEELIITTAEKNTFTFTQESTDPIMCTMEYAPVCGEVEVQCVKAPCLPVQQTFGNTCMASAAKAKNITQGECKDKNMAGIIARAYDADITRYNTEKTFMGDSFLTREQAAKMFMAAIDYSKAPEWMIKQPAGSCEWSDATSIDPTLLDMVQRACAKWLFKGTDEGKFMPHRSITATEMNTVLERVAGFIPGLEYTMMNLLKSQGSTKLTRNEFVGALYDMVTSITEQTRKYSEHKEALSGARALWAEKGSDSYTLIQQMTCFCMVDYTRPVSYEVQNNVIQTGTIKYSDDNSAIASGVILSYHTIQAAFDMIDQAISDHVASLNVTYDETLGYPKSISIDYNEMIADEEKYYTFTINK